MSLPRRIPSHSTSPSKSSLRRVSSPQTQPRNLLPSPHFDEAAGSQSPSSLQIPNSFENGIADSSSRLPRTFQPFFTLIEDTVTHEHFHPTVHYIFADDEADAITEAACRSLAQDDGSQAVTSETESHYLPAEKPGVKEHYLVLDVQPTEDVHDGGLDVTQAQSQSSEWQVLRTNITQAPTIGDTQEDEGLMLRIEGRGNTPPDAKGKGIEQETVEEMIERFQKRLEDVRQVMLAGDVGQDAGQ